MSGTRCGGRSSAGKRMASKVGMLLFMARAGAGLLSGEAEDRELIYATKSSIARPGKGAGHFPDRPEVDLTEGLEVCQLGRG
ncbi:hypothetical protein L227DRAFT_47792 [Lentinus tigrinus ALCF2SS1-6]|uniref:Uncharacterized protein n=1 Tax=Lentinus tigrinus ALCF2SS1-6 TaxID=1328759 RepID=A0A5C2SE70_9APHY|nr:hypothetical protein L227DRAFT_47792 [Lentinus tigrinus ALCF2SS1-6]